ncbi:MAG: hypothetical protein ACI8W8_001192 [Rhodothermales bacterium]|jgi:hypothetical protein
MAMNEHDDVERLLAPVAGATLPDGLRSRVLAAAETEWRPAPKVMPWLWAAAAAIVLGCASLELEERAMTNALRLPDGLPEQCIACRYDISPGRWQHHDSWWQSRQRDLNENRRNDG